MAELQLGQALSRSHVERWARERLLRIEVVQSLPKAVQRDFIQALIHAYAMGFAAAVEEMEAGITSEGANDA